MLDLFNVYPPVVIAFWKDNELIGFRSNSYGGISKTKPQVRRLFPELSEMEVALCKAELVNSRLEFLKFLSRKNVVFMNSRFEVVPIEDVIKDATAFSTLMRKELKEFKLCIHPFVDVEDGEDWKIEAELAQLKPPIFEQKFKVLEYEN